MRTFIAIDIPETQFIKELYQYLTQNLIGVKVKYTQPQQNHLTLAFLGEISSSQADILIKSLHGIQLGKKSIILKLTGMGVFQSNKQPNVLWIGINHNEELSNLWSSINSCVRNAEINIGEHKKFSPHITVGRIKEAQNNNNISMIVEKYKLADFGKIVLTHFNLYKSTLTPAGPIYEVLQSFNFK